MSRTFGSSSWSFSGSIARFVPCMHSEISADNKGDAAPRYWYRSAEITACFFESATHSTCDETEATQWTSDGVNFFEKTNDFYISNAAWAMFVTATSVGYGDIFPTTHLGRLVASISALVGLSPLGA
eukprot:3892195-Rhodomonas_salina.5